ncbi:hypothetical protein KIW84_034925 [Lathyrus oleraceus]|uniref:Pentatricopeptide repeat-containing protein n=1 Tax=Pisum sativum TaxID=3888 RepID=A0A9D5B1R5_PEA|nr:hypothetical protein KIW84_034925 [Pisum sativum]
MTIGSSKGPWAAQIYPKNSNRWKSCHSLRRVYPLGSPDSGLVTSGIRSEESLIERRFFWHQLPVVDYPLFSQYPSWLPIDGLSSLSSRLEDCVDEIDAQRVFGYALYEDGKNTKLSYPLENFDSNVYGRSFQGNIDRARNVIEFMKNNGCCPNVFNYLALVDGLCKVGKPEDAKGVLAEMKNFGLKPDTVTYTSLINFFCRNGKIDEAIELLKEMKENECEVDTVTFNVILGGLCREGRFDEALDTIEKLPHQCVYLNKANPASYPLKNLQEQNFPIPVQPVNFSFKPCATSDMVGGNSTIPKWVVKKKKLSPKSEPNLDPKAAMAPVVSKRKAMQATTTKLINRIWDEYYSNHLPEDSKEVDDRLLSSLSSSMTFHWLSTDMPTNLQKCLKEDGVNITANSLHPGIIVTNLSRHNSAVPTE